MGSSKKHKEKHRKRRRDRSRSESRESDDKHDRGRDRSRSPSRREENIDEDYRSDGYYKKKVSRKSEDFRDMDDRQRDRDYQEEVERQRLSNQEKKRRKDYEYESSNNLRSEIGKEEDGGEVTKQKSSGDVSLSIEETNKLRVKLGLKPLQMEGEKNDKEDASYDERPDVHLPPQNISTVKKADSLKEKMEEIREKRRIHKKLQRVKKLGEEEDPAEESASAWVKKMRKQEDEKRMAAKRAKLLEEMDDEFGVSGVINEAMGEVPKRAIKKEPKYSARDLAGLKIQHAGGEISDGSSVIVTLKDKGVLEDNEDVLENVNLVEQRAAIRNIENRKKRPGYVAYEEVDEETGVFKVKGILDKYNEEIDGKEEKFIRIDASGQGDLEDEYEIDRMTLAVDAPQLATDYYTQEEMVQFKKPKKKRKVRKREIVKADDLLPLPDEPRPDPASRKRPKSILKNSANCDIPMDIEEDQLEESSELEEEREFLRRMQALENAPVEEDEAELELQMALARSRKAKVKKEPDEILVLEKLAEKIQASNEEESQKRDKRKSKSDAIVLDSTSEFCRTLGELPSIGHSHDIKDEEEEEDQEMEITGGWEQVVVTDKKEKPSEQKHEAVLEEEPDLKVGVGAALKVALMKGLIDAQKKKVLNTGPTNLPKTKAVVDEEKMREEERDRGRRAYDRERYDPYSFKEKDSYKPEVKLEYVDEHGRPMNEKEAFRFLSHKFHGKGSGKMKSEKRAKKVAEEMKMKKMSAIDTPLNTAQMMIDRQQLSQTPYVVLSGGGKNLLTT
eukprot:gene13329-4175_t